MKVPANTVRRDPKVYDNSIQGILDQARTRTREMPVDEAHEILKRGNNLTLVDMREPEELSLGYIEGSIFVRGDELEIQAQHLLPNKNASILLYCNRGIRSLLMASTLKDMGYRDVRNLAGGIEAWKAAGYKVVSDGLLTEEQLTHYSRQIILPEISVEGQQKLLHAKVLLVGAGGLGSPAALYLAASGIGTLGIVDFDRVDRTNLNRQILHDYADVGRRKIDSAKEKINNMNPDVDVITVEERLTHENAREIIKNFDIIIDGSDNFPTKFLLNDVSFLEGKPYIYGGAVRFEGQASVFYPKANGPCLRCMMPAPPPAELVPT